MTIEKTDLRQYLLLKQGLISSESRKTREAIAAASLKELLLPFKTVLSFMNFGLEIDIQPVNAHLASLGMLCLPRIESGEIHVYHVGDLSSLSRSKWGIDEPVLEKCRKASPHEIDCILVPGLGFDRSQMRLGRGKGHYDRFLALSSAVKWGIGFREQFLDCLFSRESHDIPMDAIHLF